jgi:hypothetical protein
MPMDTSVIPPPVPLDTSPMEAMRITLARIEARLDAMEALLSGALRDEEDEPPALDLDGNPVGMQREEGTPL